MALVTLRNIFFQFLIKSDNKYSGIESELRELVFSEHFAPGDKLTVFGEYGAIRQAFEAREQFDDQ